MSVGLTPQDMGKLQEEVDLVATIEKLQPFHQRASHSSIFPLSKSRTCTCITLPPPGPLILLLIPLIRVANLTLLSLAATPQSAELRGGLPADETARLRLIYETTKSGQRAVLAGTIDDFVALLISTKSGLLQPKTNRFFPPLTFFLLL